MRVPKGDPDVRHPISLDERLERWKLDTLTLATEIELGFQPRAEATARADALRQAAVLVRLAEEGRLMTIKL